ncbi:Gfo/Idh/MocA family oxidoreductase [Microbacterium sp. NPDC076768]|uniref:Gfo/Idh/MocA family protein n=1 Tax=Microbacterium sp. NPDC076768 TaxID=3154858 RepID=UPI003431EA7F
MTAGNVRLGIVGAGFVADFFLQALQHVRGHEVTVLSSRDVDKGNKLAERFGVPAVVGTPAELAAREDVDIVVVAVPQDAHVEVVSTAASAGKAVICTKPLGRSGAEAAACLAAVTEAGVWHGYAETAVFSPAVVRAKAMVDAGAIGRVLSVRAREAHGSPHKHALDSARMGGGPLRGLGCHGVAVGRHFLEGASPVDVFAWGARLDRDDVDSEDNALMMVRFDDGRVAQVEAGWTHVPGLDVRREIHGSNGWLGADETGGAGLDAFAGQDLGYVMEKAGATRGWLRPVLDEPWAYGYHGQFDHFIASYNAGVAPMQTLADGVIDNSIIDAGYRSMESGVWEPVDLASMAEFSRSGERISGKG